MKGCKSFVQNSILFFFRKKKTQKTIRHFFNFLGLDVAIKSKLSALTGVKCNCHEEKEEEFKLRHRGVVCLKRLLEVERIVSSIRRSLYFFILWKRRETKQNINREKRIKKQNLFFHGRFGTKGKSLSKRGFT